VKRVADRQLHDGAAGSDELIHDSVHRIGRPADHRLIGAVDVGDDASIDAGHSRFDLGKRGQHRRHDAAVLDLEVAHLPTAGTHRLECVLEGEAAGRHQRAVLAEAVTHDEVGHDPVGAE